MASNMISYPTTLSAQRHKVKELLLGKDRKKANLGYLAKSLHLWCLSRLCAWALMAALC